MSPWWRRDPRLLSTGRSLPQTVPSVTPGRADGGRGSRGEHGGRGLRRPIDARRGHGLDRDIHQPREARRQPSERTGRVRGQIVISRPPTDVIRLDVTELKVPSHPSLTLCVQVPSGPSDREKLARII